MSCPEITYKQKTSYVRNADGDPIFLMDYEVAKKAMTNDLPRLVQRTDGDRLARAAIVIAVLYFVFFLWLILGSLVIAVALPVSMIAYIFNNKEYQL